jgi:hypothetical protein
VQVDKPIDEFPFAYLAFGDPKYYPAEGAQMCRRVFISSAIALNLVLPIFPIGAGNPTTLIASMPETAVYEDSDLAARPSEIRLSNYWPMLTIASEA